MLGEIFLNSQFSTLNLTSSQRNKFFNFQFSTFNLRKWLRRIK